MEIVQVQFKVTDGQQNKTRTISGGFHECQAEDFEKNDFERNFYEYYSVEKSHSLICFNQARRKDVVFEGIRDYEFLKLNTSYVTFRFSPCDESRLTDDQKARGVKCKSKEVIKEWRERKNIITLSLEGMPNFASNSTETLIHAEKWFKSLPMREGVFTDVGLRFRYETYNRSDADYFNPWVQTKTVDFYTLQEFNFDSFVKGETKDDTYFFAEIWYRLDT